MTKQDEELKELNLALARMEQHLYQVLDRGNLHPKASKVSPSRDFSSALGILRLFNRFRGKS
jgi:hypothetical protein